MAGQLTIKLGVDEDTQMSSYQNAALHGGPGQTAISIDAEAAFPEGVQSEAQMKAHLEQALKSLVDQGWKFNVYIGPDVDRIAAQDD